MRTWSQLARCRIIGNTQKAAASDSQKVLAAIQELDTKTRERHDGQCDQISNLHEQLCRTDERVLVMQRWIWGLCGSSLLVIIILAFTGCFGEGMSILNSNPHTQSLRSIVFDCSSGRMPDWLVQQAQSCAKRYAGLRTTSEFDIACAGFLSVASNHSNFS